MADERAAVTIEDVEDIVRRKFGGLVDESISMLTLERLRPEIDARMNEVKTERDAELDILEQRLKAYTDQQLREWDKHQQARVTDALQQIDDLAQRMVNVSESVEARISSHENRTRDQLKSFENRIVSVENSATSRDRQIQAIENNTDDLIRLTAENAAAAKANAIAIKLLRRDLEKYEAKLEDAVKRNNELHNKIDNVQGKVDDVHEDMQEQRAHRERWRRRGSRLLDFLASSAGRRALISLGAAITTAIGAAAGWWQDVIEGLKRLF